MALDELKSLLARGLAAVGAHPALVAAVAGLIRWKVRGQVLPPCTGAQGPQHGFEHLALAAPRPAASICSPGRFRQQPLQQSPLRVG